MNKRKCDVVAEAERTGLRVAQLQAEARAAVGLSRSHSAEPGQLDRCKEFTSPCTVDPLSGGGRQGKLADTCKAAPMADSNEVEAQYIANSKIPTSGWFQPCRTCRQWTASTLTVQECEVSICKRCQLCLVRRYSVKRTRSMDTTSVDTAARELDESPDSVRSSPRCCA